MSHSATDRESAIEKLDRLDFTSAELEAIAAILDESCQVEGFARTATTKGHGFLLEISARMANKEGPVSGLGLGSGRAVEKDGFTLNEELLQ